VTRGVKQEIAIQSYPSEACITIDGIDCGKTPQSFLLTRKHSHEIVIAKEGFKNETFLLRSQWSPLATTNGIPLLATATAWGGILLFDTPVGFAAGVLTVVAGSAAIVAATIGLVSLGIDAGTGAAYTLNHSRIEAHLHQIN